MSTSSLVSSGTYIDAIQLRVAAHVPSLKLAHYFLEPLPDPIHRLLPGNKIRASTSGSFYVGVDRPGITRLEINGATIFRGVTSSPSVTSIPPRKPKDNETNQLTDNERQNLHLLLLQDSSMENEPWQWMASKFCDLVGSLQISLENFAKSYARRIGQRVQLAPFLLYRLELYREYEFGTHDAKSALAKIELAVAQSQGFRRHRDSFEDGGLQLIWNIKVRNGDCRKKRDEALSLKAYIKGQRIRLEFSFEKPSLTGGRRLPELIGPDELKETIFSLAEDASKRFEFIESHLHNLSSLPSKESLFSALEEAFNIQNPRLRDEWVTFVNHLSTVGIYDPERACSESGVCVGYHALRYLVANSAHGILRKQPRQAANGPGRLMYRLRENWLERAAAYRALRIERAQKVKAAAKTKAAARKSAKREARLLADAPTGTYAQ